MEILEVLEKDILVIEGMPIWMENLTSTMIAITSKATLEITVTNFNAILREKKVDLPLMQIVLLREEIISMMVEAMTLL